jgi:leader peptidase (prepilin peptidase) / N-methyltransferase
MTEYLVALQTGYPVLAYSIAFCFGAIVGSFLNVVILRTPVMLQREWETQANEILGIESSNTRAPFNLVFPGSHCPACSHKISPWENIPIISYLILRGRCRNCRINISPRYPLIELLTGLLTVMLAMQFGFTVTMLACSIMTFALIAASTIDYDHQLIPDDITLPMMWLGLIVNFFDIVTPFESAFWGAVAGYLTLWIVFQVFRWVTGKEGLGFGDFKLLAMLGAWLGWEMLPLVIILSSFAGALIGGTLIVLGRARDNPIPFGPYLAIAGFIALLWGPQINSAYLRFAAF